MEEWESWENLGEILNEDSFKNIELIGEAYLYITWTSSVHLIRKFGKLALTIERHALFETSFISTVLFKTGGDVVLYIHSELAP